MTKYLKRTVSQLEQSWLETPSQQTLDWIWYLILCAQEIVKTDNGDAHPVLVKAAEEITATTLSTYIALQQTHDRQNVEREFKQRRRQALRVIQKARSERSASKRGQETCRPGLTIH